MALLFSSIIYYISCLLCKLYYKLNLCNIFIKRILAQLNIFICKHDQYLQYYFTVNTTIFKNHSTPGDFSAQIIAPLKHFVNGFSEH